jgi:hypothetical protein
MIMALFFLGMSYSDYEVQFMRCLVSCIYDVTAVNQFT